MMSEASMRVSRILRKPPRVILQRALSECNVTVDRFRMPRRERRFDTDTLLSSTSASSLEQLWNRLSTDRYAVPVGRVTAPDYEAACPGDAARIFSRADNALAHRVDLLGSGPIQLGPSIDWQTDFKTGVSWSPAFMRDINYTNLDRPSDVKVPWELSRLQWLMPAGQAYLLTGDEKYALAVRAVLEDWIQGNPYGHSVNWTCTMEVALRILTWTWFFQVFSQSSAWSDAKFQSQFLRALYLHGEFTAGHLERSDINGNHLTADVAGLTFAGLFFNAGRAPERWARRGWMLLCEELPRQVFPDGVDFEASVPYHRLVLELFFLPALYRESRGLSVPADYRDRLIAMAGFTQAYTAPDGSAPFIGDADDARVLPFGGQAIHDHRYLVGVIGAHWGISALTRTFSGPRSEIFWTLGASAVASLPLDGAATMPSASSMFPDGGFYVMRNEVDHVFIDCGPIGLAGRGGHGHNDCLSFEAVLTGSRLVSDCGSYVYTASAVERNNFRSTAYHNTPQIDGEEINRFVRWDHLWTLHNDAHPRVTRWDPGPERDVFEGGHSGYARLRSEIYPQRTITLDHERHSLEVVDNIAGVGVHTVTIPLHLAPGVRASYDQAGALVLTSGENEFTLTWHSAEQWELTIGQGRVSPRYGVVVPVGRLLWRRVGELPATLKVCLSPRQRRLTDADA